MNIESSILCSQKGLLNFMTLLLFFMMFIQNSVIASENDAIKFEIKTGETYEIINDGNVKAKIEEDEKSNTTCCYDFSSPRLSPEGDAIVMMHENMGAKDNNYISPGHRVYITVNEGAENGGKFLVVEGTGITINRVEKPALSIEKLDSGQAVEVPFDEFKRNTFDFCHDLHLETPTDVNISYTGGVDGGMYFDYSLGSKNVTLYQRYSMRYGVVICSVMQGAPVYIGYDYVLATKESDRGTSVFIATNKNAQTMNSTSLENTIKDATDEDTESSSILTVEDVRVGVKLNWKSSEDAKAYRIYRSTNDNEKGDIICEYIESTSFVDIEAEPGTTYYYSIYRLIEDKKGSFVEDGLVSGIKEITTAMNPDKEPGHFKNFILMKIGNTTMLVNNKEIEIDPSRGTVPMILNGRTVMPIRAVIEAMGGEVGWDEESRAVTLNANGSKIEMVIDNYEFTVNGLQKPLDVPPQIINGRTMLPVRFVAENIGCLIEWIGSTQEIVIVF